MMRAKICCRAQRLNLDITRNAIDVIAGMIKGFKAYEIWEELGFEMYEQQ